MRVKNRQEQKYINNVFLKLLYLFLNFVYWVIFSLYLFLFGWLYTIKKPHFAIYEIFDFISWQWPKKFIEKSSAYSITKYIGDFIHHIFLKK